MTPSQMLARVQKANPERRKPRTGLILLPATTLTRDELAKADETYALQSGICPVCSLKVELSAHLDGSIEFQCVSGSPYHWFKRGASFLKLD